MRISAWSIQNKFLLVIAPLVLLTLACVAAITTLANYAEHKQRLGTKLDQIVANQSIVLARALSEHDTRFSGLILAGLMADPDIVYAAVLDPAGETVMTLGQPPHFGKTAQREVRIVEHLDVVSAGSLIIGISYGSATEALWTDLRRTTLSALFAIATIWIVTIFGFYRVISIPLDNLQTQIREWRGNLESEPNVSRGDELTALTSAFATLQRERLEYEQALEDMNLRLEARVQERTEAMRKALAAAKQADSAKAEFLAAMSHEIRTPMNAILGIAHALSASNTLPGQQRNFDIMLESGRTLMVLLDDVLDLSRIEAGRLEVVPVSSDLRELMRDICDLWRPQAREKGIALRLEVDDTVPVRLSLDPVRLRQCVSNLVSNAVKFTHQGQIEVSVWADAPPSGPCRLFLSVRDTGIGIDLDRVERLFDPFTQADGSLTRRFGGTGLGLAITQRLAALLDGDIFVASELGEGTVFRLSLLAARPTRSYNHALPRAGDSVATRWDSKLAGRRILVVDDMQTNRYVARLLLEQAGADVEDVADGREALDCLEASAYDLVLLDLHMPHSDGFGMLDRIKALPGPASQVPVIVLTADARPEIRVRLEEHGVDGYLSKPIDFPAAVAEISRVLPGRSNVIELPTFGSAF